MARMYCALACALAYFVSFTAGAADETYVLDPAHSQPLFEVQHLGGFSTQRASFSKIGGKVTLDRAAKKGSVDVTIDTASVRTFSERLDAHMKGEDFFNVTKYPTMTFKSTRVVFDGEKVASIDGDLTMLGVAKPVSLKVTHFTCGEHPFNKKPMCGGEAVANIKRSDWGMSYGAPKAVSDEVKLILPFEAARE